MSKSNSSKVPSSRLSRVGHVSALAAKLMGNTMLSGAKDIAYARRPSMQSTVLNSQNAHSIATQLTKMRGAAMKVGQMLSMDPGEFLPPQWEPILATLRDGANSMPKSQLLATLEHAWGNDWAAHFTYFSFDPIAAASIGQVHKAQLKSGKTLAVKVQYPGVAASIDSDIDNVGRLLKMSRLLPANFALNELLSQAKAQLHKEADYELEARYLTQYKENLKHDPRFLVPGVYTPLSTDKVLCMEFVEGENLDSLYQQPDGIRADLVDALFSLMLDELFTYSFMQSDPNFANYLYLPTTKQIALLDFGACQQISIHNQSHYKALAKGMYEQDILSMKNAMLKLNLLHNSMPSNVQEAIIKGCLIASECLQSEMINFKKSGIIKRIYEATQVLMSQREAVQSPDFDTALINRKVSGMVLLANKLECDLSLRALVKAKLLS